MQISPLAGDKNDYFIFLLTLQLSSRQCCIITTYSLFVSHFCDAQCDLTWPGPAYQISGSSDRESYHHYMTSSITILSRGEAQIAVIKHQHSQPCLSSLAPPSEYTLGIEFIQWKVKLSTRDISSEAWPGIHIEQNLTYLSLSPALQSWDHLSSTFPVISHPQI